MKLRPLFTIVITAACVISCHTHKTITATEGSSDTEVIDTTKTVSDLATHLGSAIDTTKTVVTHAGGGVIEFIESGGKVNIGPDGNVMLEGVKNLRGRQRSSAAQARGIARHDEDTAAHRGQVNGIAAKQTTQQKRTEEKTPAPKWCENTFARLGQGVIIAALLWMLFLYLRRKR